jgi:mRNA interferase YafQ
MRNAVLGAQLRRDVKLARKRGKDLARLREAVSLLWEGTPLPDRCRDHPLRGDWSGFRDCRLDPDWLII